MPDEPRYVPAAGRVALTPLYDRVMALTMRESRWRPALTASVLAGVDDGDTVVEVGCGTATQAIDMAARRPGITVIGVDGDPRVLELARRKPGAAPLDLRAGDATALPLEDGSAAAVEAHRVLRPGGGLQVEVMRRVRTVFGTLELLAAR